MDQHDFANDGFAETLRLSIAGRHTIHFSRLASY
jgi:hypothetical protein